MAWNDSGSDNKNPWGNRDQQGPPDLEKIIRDFLKKVGISFSSDRPSVTGSSKSSFSFIIGIIAVLAVVVWAACGFTVVNPGENAAVLRFGKYNRTWGPGLHWAPPLIESVYTVNVESTKKFTYTDQMLTRGENIVSVAVVVQYKINNLEDYLFKAVDPDETLKQATASATRQEIGQEDLDAILTDGGAVSSSVMGASPGLSATGSPISPSIEDTLKKMIEPYQLGIQIVNVAMQPAQPPEEVSDAFAEVIKARENQTTYKNEAQAYVNKVLALAQGTRARILADADAYQQEVLRNAQASVAKFKALDEVYKTEGLKQVTHDRLYLDAMEDVYGQSAKVLVDVKGANNLINLPSPSLIPDAKKEASAPSVTAAPAPAPAAIGALVNQTQGN